MKITMTQPATLTAAAPRLNELVHSFALPVCPTPIADWSPAQGMRNRSAVVPLDRNHNSITRTAPNFGAAKQAAPPRGVPR